MLCILLIEYLVFSTWSSNGVLGRGFFSKVRISCVTCVSLSSDDVFDMYTCAGNNSTVLLTLYPIVFGI